MPTNELIGHFACRFSA